MGEAAGKVHAYYGERERASVAEARATAAAEAAQRLQASEERLRLAFEAGHSGSFDWDAPTDTNVWSDELLALYGLRREEFGGRYQDWIACLLPEDREAGARAVQRSLQTGEFAVEFRIRRKDTGETRWMHGRGRVLFGTDGRPARMIGLNVDITGQKRAEEERRSVALFPEQNPHPILRIASDCTLLYANRGSHALLTHWGAAVGEPRCWPLSGPAARPRCSCPARSGPTPSSPSRCPTWGTSTSTAAT
jgi:PAS domain S-box-containing protein